MKKILRIIYINNIFGIIKFCFLFREILLRKILFILFIKIVKYFREEYIYMRVI